MTTEVSRPVERDYPNVPSSLSLLSPGRLLFACSSVVLLSSACINHASGLLSLPNEVRKNFLRSTVPTQAKELDDDAPCTVDKDDAYGLRRALIRLVQSSSAAPSSLNQDAAPNERQVPLGFHPQDYLADEFVGRNDHEYEYEMFRERLKIQPALIGSSLMRAMNDHASNGNILSFAGTNDAMKRLDESRQSVADKNETTVHQLARLDRAEKTTTHEDSAEELDTHPAERGRRMLLPVEGEKLVPDSTSFELTLSQIVQSRSSLLYALKDESDHELSNEPTNDPTNEPTTSNKPTNGPTIKSRTTRPTSRPTNAPTNEPTRGFTNHPTSAFPSKPTNGPTNKPAAEELNSLDSAEELNREPPADDQAFTDDGVLESGSRSYASMSPMQVTNTGLMLERSASDLDRGSYMVGLEVRDIQPHQQILLDYKTTSDNGDESRLQPIRIHYKLALGAGDISGNQLYMLNQLIETSFSAAADAWSEALSLTRVQNRISPTTETCGAARILASDREDGVEKADIVIYVSGDNRFCGGALMHSAVCDFDQFTRPLVANINICTSNFPESNSTAFRTLKDSTLDEYAGYLTTETGRILGASTSLFRYYNDPLTMTRYGTTEKSLTCVDGTEEVLEVPNIIDQDIDRDGNSIFEIRTPTVMETVRNHFGCMTLTGARLEQGSDSIGCFGGFLDDHIFYSEAMTGFMASSTNGPSISPLTLALLEDSSWYSANYRNSDVTSFGRGAGCQFAQSGCQLDEASTFINNDSSGFHCTDIGKMGCDASHSHKAKCDFLDLVQSSSADSFCPMYTRQASSCSDGFSNIFAIQGEYYGESSKCFTTDKEPLCLRSECNESTGTIDVYYGDKVYTCHRDGHIIKTKAGPQITCPSIAAVCPHLSCPSNCSGRGICDTDWDGKHSCICDNPFDQSPGCYGENR